MWSGVRLLIYRVSFPLGPSGSLAPVVCQGGVQGLALRRVTCQLEWQSSGLDLCGGRFKNKKA